MLFLQPDLGGERTRFRITPITNPERAFKGTHPQLRHRQEQVKYSSGKKQLLAASSPVISPLKRSLSACREIADATKLAGQRWRKVNKYMRLSADLPVGLCR